MPLPDNKNTRDDNAYVQTFYDETARRVNIDPHTAALFNLTVEIQNGVNISKYMVNDFAEIIINDKGQLLE